MSHSPSSVELAEMILRYLGAHPGACDSLKGICDWWLARQKRDDLRISVAAALEELVADGRIEASTGTDGRTLYRAMPGARHLGQSTH